MQRAPEEERETDPSASKKAKISEDKDSSSVATKEKPETVVLVKCNPHKGLDVLLNQTISLNKNLMGDEIGKIKKAWKQRKERLGHTDDSFKVKGMSSATPWALLGEVEDENVTVLHMTGHMDDNALEPAYAPILTTPKGIPCHVSPDTVTKIIAGKHKTLKVVVLNGCCSESLGVAMIKAGVSNVVAWRTVSLCSSGGVFAPAFHEYFAKHGNAREAYVHACNILRGAVQDVLFAQKSVYGEGFKTEAEKKEYKERIENNNYETNMPAYVICNTPCGGNLHIKVHDKEAQYIVWPKNRALQLRKPSGVPVFLTRPYDGDLRCGLAWKQQFSVDTHHVAGLRGDAMTKLRESMLRHTEDLILNRPKVLQTDEHRRTKVFAIQGPTGTGKTSMVHELLRHERIQLRYGQCSGGGIFFLDGGSENKLNEARKLLHDLLVMHVTKRPVEASEVLQYKNKDEVCKRIKDILTTEWPKAEGWNEYEKIWDDLESVRPVLIVLDEIYMDDIDFCRGIMRLPLPLGSAILMTFQHQTLLTTFCIKPEDRLQIKPLSTDDTRMFFETLCETTFTPKGWEAAHNVAKFLDHRMYALKVICLDVRVCADDEDCPGLPKLWERQLQELLEQKPIKVDLDVTESESCEKDSFSHCLRRCLKRNVRKHGSYEAETMHQFYFKLAILPRKARMSLLGLQHIWKTKSREETKKIATTFTRCGLLECQAREGEKTEGVGGTKDAGAGYDDDQTRVYVLSNAVFPFVRSETERNWRNDQKQFFSQIASRNAVDIIRSDVFSQWKCVYDACAEMECIGTRCTLSHPDLELKFKMEYSHILRRSWMSSNGSIDGKLLLECCDDVLNDLEYDGKDWQKAYVLFAKGKALHTLGRYEDAAKAFNTCRSMRENAEKYKSFLDETKSGWGHRDIYVSYCSYAMSLRKFAAKTETTDPGKAKSLLMDAKRAYEVALKMMGSLYEEDPYKGLHAYIATTLKGIGAVYFSLKMYKDARKKFLESLKMLEKLAPKKKREERRGGVTEATRDFQEIMVADVLSNLGTVCVKLGKWEEAKSHFNNCGEVHSKCLGGDHPHPKKVKLLWSRARMHKKRNEKNDKTISKDFYDAALKMCKGLYGGDWEKHALPTSIRKERTSAPAKENDAMSSGGDTEGGGRTTASSLKVKMLLKESITTAYIPTSGLTMSIFRDFLRDRLRLGAMVSFKFEIKDSEGDWCEYKNIDDIVRDFGKSASMKVKVTPSSS